jgi:protein Mpv17
MNFWRTYNKILKTKPIIVNTSIGFILGFTGDIICQIIEPTQPQSQSQSQSQSQPQSQRLLSITAFSGIYHGVVNPLIYKTYYKIIPKKIIKTQLQFGITCSLLDNFVHVPFLYTPSFFLSTSVLQNKSIDSGLELMKEKYIPSLTACWAMWIPLQIINFAYIPKHMRPTVVNIGCLVWTVAIDYISHNTIPIKQ